MRPVEPVSQRRRRDAKTSCVCVLAKYHTTICHCFTQLQPAWPSAHVSFEYALILFVIFPSCLLLPFPHTRSVPLLKRGKTAPPPPSAGTGAGAGSARKPRKVRLTPMKRLILRARRQALVHAALDAIVTRAFHMIVGNEAERLRVQRQRGDATALGGAGDTGTADGSGSGGGVSATKVGAAAATTSGSDSQLFPIVRLFGCFILLLHFCLRSTES